MLNETFSVIFKHCVNFHDEIDLFAQFTVLRNLVFVHALGHIVIVTSILFLCTVESRFSEVFGQQSNLH